MVNKKRNKALNKAQASLNKWLQRTQHPLAAVVLFILSGFSSMSKHRRGCFAAEPRR